MWLINWSLTNYYQISIVLALLSTSCQSRAAIEWSTQLISSFKGIPLMALHYNLFLNNKYSEKVCYLTANYYSWHNTRTELCNCLYQTWQRHKHCFMFMEEEIDCNKLSPTEDICHLKQWRTENKIRHLDCMPVLCLHSDAGHWVLMEHKIS